MKILIIGKNSYIGNHIDEWLTRYGHKVEQLDVLTEDWKTYDYSPYDAIVHVAGIVHRPDCKDWKLYHDVNTVMPVQIAKLFKASLGSNGSSEQSTGSSSLNGSSSSSSSRAKACSNGSTLEQPKALNSEALNSSSAALNRPKVKTFVFFSTMGVYDAGKKLAPSVVDENTPLLNEGNSMYGKSKAMAECELLKLATKNEERKTKESFGASPNTNCHELPTNLSMNSSFEPLALGSAAFIASAEKEPSEAIEPLEPATFNVAIVRPPSVYGKGCKGGYITGFKKIASVLPVIPRAYENACQSFIYIDNLSECVRLIVENSSICSSGSNVFCPQDDEIPNANRLLEVICKGIGKKYRCSRILGWLLEMVNGSICSNGSRGWIPLVKKAYGGIEYSRKLSDIPGMNYVVVPFEEGMRRTVAQ